MVAAARRRLVGGKGSGSARRSLTLLLVGGLGAVVIVALALSLRGPSSSTPATAVGSAAPTGFASALKDDLEPAGGGRVAWTTRWELRWAAVPGARDYLVTLGTPEGLGTSPRVAPEPRFGLSVASGENLRAKGLVGRDAQLAAQAAQLTVTVAARFPDGTVGPKSEPMPVGERP